MKGDDCISRAEAIKAVRKAYSIYIPRMNGWEEGLPFKIDKAIYDLPSIQPKTGHWLYSGENGADNWTCDNCFDFVKKPTKFCHNCGAKMESEG